MGLKEKLVLVQACPEEVADLNPVFSTYQRR